MTSIVLQLKVLIIKENADVNFTTYTLWFKIVEFFVQFNWAFLVPHQSQMDILKMSTNTNTSFNQQLKLKIYMKIRNKIIFY